MSLPPEQIRLKRKATDAAPETLYLQTDSPKRPRRSADFAFQLLRSGVKPAALSKTLLRNTGVDQISRRSFSQHGQPSVPIVRATAPGEEFEEQRRLKALREQELQLEKSLKDDKALEAIPSTSTSTNTASERQVPRRFHLTKPTARSIDHQTGATQRQGQLNIALFVERKLKPQTSSSSNVAPSPAGNWSGRSTQSGIGTLRKKRPKSNAAEKLFLDGQKQVRNEIDKRNCETHIPLEQSAQEGGAAEPTGGPTTAAQQILFDMAEESKGISSMRELKTALDENIMELDSQEDYVYETYIRVPRSQLNDADDLTAAGRTYGILVIDEEDQGLWDMYAEADEDPTWEEEDEDSNAEDNPANEYPEDEIDSEDEFGFGAYKKRHNASDDEEYDFEHDAWSDEEDRLPPFR